MNYLSSNINKKTTFHNNNKIFLNMPLSNNKVNQKIFSFYSSSSSSERLNHKRIKNSQLSRNPYLTINDSSNDSKGSYNNYSKNYIENYFEVPKINNINLRFRNLKEKIGKISQVVSNSNSQNKNKLNDYYNIQKSRNVFPIEQIKYETFTNFNKFYPVRDNYNQININIRTPNYKEPNYKPNNNINNKSLNMNNIDSYQINDNTNKKLKYSFLQKVNVAKITFTPGIQETSINESNIGKVSIEISGNKIIKKEPSDNNLNLSELANDLVKAFNLDDKHKKRIKNHNTSGFNLKKSFIKKEKEFNKNQLNININNHKYEKEKNVEKKEISNKNKNQTLNVITSNHIYYNSKNDENKNQIINKENKNKKIIEENNLLNKQKVNEKIENKIKNIEEKNNNDNLNEEEDENDKLINEIVKSVYNQNKKNEKKKRHISFNLGNKKEESNKVIIPKQKLPSDHDLFQNIIEKMNKNKGNLLPFKKEDIIIDKDYISAELKDEFELFNKKRKTIKTNNKPNNKTYTSNQE